MQVARRILGGTPPWAFALLAYFIWQGLRSLKPRTLAVWRALVVPALFICMGVSRLTFGHETGMTSWLWWTAGAILFAPLAIVTGPRIVAVDRDRRRVTRPGSAVPLVRNVTVFVLQYVVAVAGAMQIEGRTQLEIIGHAVPGAEAGYFAAWSLLFLKRYRDVGAPGPPG